MRPDRTYGWRPDLPDQRDHVYAAPQLASAALPPIVNLESGFPPVEDQFDLGSCTANAIVGAFEYDRRKQKLPALDMSRLFIYYNERAMEGTIASDAGASLRDGIKSIASLGACSEGLWPYDVGKFAVRPTDACYRSALTHRAIKYGALTPTIFQMQQTLAGGLPFVFGFTCYEGFESDMVAKTGILPMPQRTERAIGGHAVVCVGYDQAAQTFRIRNSWGAHWGQKGYFTMPYAYLNNGNLSDDFWVVQAVT